LGDIPESEEIKRILLEEWGPFVSNYGWGIDHFPSVLQWKNIDQLAIPEEVKNRFKSVLQEKQVLLSNQQDEIVWTAASSGFFKLNFDGAARGNLGASGAGCLIRNSLGQVVKAASFKLKDDSCNFVELQALSKGLDLVASLNIGNLEIEEDMVAVKSVLGGDFLKVEGWSRVNSGTVSIFVENLLVLCPSKADVVNLALHWVQPSFCGNLASNVANCNVLFWAASDGEQGSSVVNTCVFKELEKRFRVLMEFSENLVAFARDRNLGHARIKLPNLKALNLSLEPVLCWW
ncbi:hypothetical protein KI387_032607, partial [Taxus chinensis]